MVSRSMLPNSLMHARCLAIGLLVTMLLGASLPVPASVSAQSAADFPELQANQRVYDATGGSLTEAEVTALEARVSNLQSIGADVVLYVRELDATPEETLDQVEALQQAWVAATGADQDTAVAILINRDPNDPESARAGIFVGKTYNDGNVPDGEQRKIVDDSLIPPLRDGDVYGSFSDALTHLERSIVEGPSQNGFVTWSEDAGESWAPWAGLAAAVAAVGGAFSLFGKRQKTQLQPLPPTTTRPDSRTPALGASLAQGGATSSAIPATILDLAARNALDIEQESEGGRFSSPKVQLRLLDASLVNDEVERTVWNELAERQDNDVISSKNLQRIATNTTPVKKVLDQQLRDSGWLDDAAKKGRGALLGIFLATQALAIGLFVIAIAGGTWWPVIGIVPLEAVAIASLYLYAKYSPFTIAGQEEALPWVAYRTGLQDALKRKDPALNLDAVLVDSVAMGLSAQMTPMLKAAEGTGLTLRAFSASTGAGSVNSMGYLPLWMAYNTGVTSSSAGTSSTVSGGGAGGGGGAAGST